MNSLDNCINYLLTGAQHSVFQYMKKNLAQFDITPIQYGVLGCIWEFDMHNPKDIAAHLGVENSTISGILERMENISRMSAQSSAMASTLTIPLNSGVL